VLCGGLRLRACLALAAQGSEVRWPRG
jgi:hypothetical protein